MTHTPKDSMIKSIDHSSENSNKLGTSNQASKISPAEYKKLRKKSPSQKIREIVNEDIDQLIGKPDPAIPSKFIDGKLQADHIVSLKKISQMKNFEKLTAEERIQIANFKDNFIGLTKTANTSKGSKTYKEWTHYVKENIKIDSTFREKMIIKEQELEKIIQAKINTLAKGR